jgi:hypothetical protein
VGRSKEDAGMGKGPWGKSQAEWKEGGSVANKPGLSKTQGIPEKWDFLFENKPITDKPGQLVTIEGLERQ